MCPYVGIHDVTSFSDTFPIWNFEFDEFCIKSEIGNICILQAGKALSAFVVCSTEVNTLKGLIVGVLAVSVSAGLYFPSEWIPEIIIGKNVLWVYELGNVLHSSIISESQ